MWVTEAQQSVNGMFLKLPGLMMDEDSSFHLISSFKKQGERSDETR